MDRSEYAKTAFSSWNNRVAPVFDVARQIILVEFHEGRITCKTEEIIPPDDPRTKAQFLAGAGVSTLVCGAISRPTYGLVASYGITVIPFRAGDLREVIQAWIEGRIHDETFSMPGCCRQGRRREGRSMNLRAGRVWCGVGGTSEADAVGICICPKCSYQEPHERGSPCSQKQCPVCGSILFREQRGEKKG